MQICVPCDAFCDTCSGPGFMYCEQCKYYRGLDNYCTDFCPQYAYGDAVKKECVNCHQECRGGCTGSTSSDCHACSNFKIFLDEELTQVSLYYTSYTT